MVSEENQAAAEAAVEEITVTFYRTDRTSGAWLHVLPGGAIRSVLAVSNEDGELVLHLGCTDRASIVAEHALRLQEDEEKEAARAERTAEARAAIQRFEGKLRGMFDGAALPDNWQDLPPDELSAVVRAHGQGVQRLGVCLLIERGTASDDMNNPEAITVHAAAAGGAGHALDVCLAFRDTITPTMDTVQRNKLDTVQVEVAIASGLGGLAWGLTSEGEAPWSPVDVADVVPHLLAGGLMSDGEWCMAYDFTATKLYVCSNESAETTYTEAPREVFESIATGAVAEFLGAT